MFWIIVAHRIYLRVTRPNMDILIKGLLNHFHRGEDLGGDLAMPTGHCSFFPPCTFASSAGYF